MMWAISGILQQVLQSSTLLLISVAPKGSSLFHARYSLFYSLCVPSLLFSKPFVLRYFSPLFWGCLSLLYTTYPYISPRFSFFFTLDLIFAVMVKIEAEYVLICSYYIEICTVDLKTLFLNSHLYFTVRNMH